MKAYRGDVIYLREDAPDFPTLSKTRPMLVVSNDLGNEHSDIVIIIPLTTKAKAMHLPTHCEIGSRPSIALCEQIYTVRQDDIKCISWTASDADMRRVDDCLRASLEVWRWANIIAVTCLLRTKNAP